MKSNERLEFDEDGDHHFIGLIIQIGKWTIYHSGDCISYDGLADRLRSWKIDLALLPINGEETARLGKQVGATPVIPCHYEMFEFNNNKIVGE